MPEQQNNITNNIHDYLEGGLSSEQVDELWADLLGDQESYEYLETLALLKKMGSDGHFTEREESGADHTNTKRKRIYYFRYAAAVAATILITVFVVQQTEFYYNSSSSTAPISSIDYGIERSGEGLDRIESIKSHVIELSGSGKVDDAVLYLNNQFYSEEYSDIQKNELQILKGSLYYNSGMYMDAKSIFKEVIEQIDMQKDKDALNYEKSIWYYANTLLQLDEKELAIDHLNKVIELDGSYGRAAQNLLSAYTE